MRSRFPVRAVRRVSIEVTEPNAKIVNGQSVQSDMTWLFPNESITVGRSGKQSQFVVRHDRALSRCHFQLSFDGTVCELLDLGSANGTFLNGKTVKEAIIRRRAEISAGDTTFRVAIADPARSRWWQSVVTGQLHTSKTETPVDSFLAETDLDSNLPEEVAKFRAAHESPKRSTKRSRSGQTVAVTDSDLELDGDEQPEAVTLRLLNATRAGDQVELSRLLSCIRAHQSLVVGGSAWESDWRLPRELGLEPQHFSISFDGRNCIIKQLVSKADLSVNGRPIREAVLEDGDRIVAANGNFQVHLV